jgi:hypothetical protein
LLPWFVGFTVASYLSGGLLATAILSFRKGEQKVRRGGLAILITAALAGFCLWAMATQMFLDPRKIEFTGECKATKIPGEEDITIGAGREGVIKQIVDGSYIVATEQGPARIPVRGVDVWEPNPEANLPKQIVLKRDCKAILIPSGQKMLLRQGTSFDIMDAVPGSYTVEARITEKDLDASKLEQPKSVLVRARIAKEDIDKLKPREPKFTLKRACNATKISSLEKLTIPRGTKGVIKQVFYEGYTVETSQGDQLCVARKNLDAFDLNPVPAPANYAVTYVSFAPALILAVLLLVNFLFTGLASWVTEDEDREWWGRSAAWILITIVAWVVVNVIVLWGAQAISMTPGNQLTVFLGDVKISQIAKSILAAFGGVTGVVAALLALRSKLSKKLGMKLGSQWPLIIAAVVFFVLLAIVISWVLLLIGSQQWAVIATTRFLELLGGHASDAWRFQLFVVFFLTFAAALFGTLMGFFINANKFSLHATYRNRLIRAYLAASRTAEARKPSLFTGFDPADNFALCELPSVKPLHLINGALNLVKSEQLAWQERKAESFTMSRLHCGCLHVGYRPSAEYGEGITLGTAMAISGAAANPNMGYHSSPVVGFLMTLFNMRLGWWLGNPGAPGAKTWRRSGPRYSVGPLFSEALGNTTDHAKYVNLSDGGHFENLGLYEMVLRRCHWIVVSDGGEDPGFAFADLGEAVRKIRIDFGIPIEFGPMSIYPRSTIETPKDSRHRCAVGHVRYSVVDGPDAPDGVIVYIKPACYGDEPRDIYEYSKRNETFPHESTANQFFSESQFESYRMLGAYTMEKLCTDCHGDFDCFIRDILKRHLETKAPVWLAGAIEEAKNKIA